jgi:hypothetical protein
MNAFEANTHTAMSAQVTDPPTGIWGTVAEWDGVGTRRR